MQPQMLASPEQKIAVAKRDLVEAWSLLERLVVSLRKIGSHYAIPSDQTEQTPEQWSAMMTALDEYLTGETAQALAHVRRVLGEYLPDDEAEAISEQLEFWTPRN